MMMLTWAGMNIGRPTTLSWMGLGSITSYIGGESYSDMGGFDVSESEYIARSGAWPTGYL